MTNFCTKLQLRAKILWLRLDIFARTHYYSFWLLLFIFLRLTVIFLPGPDYSDVTHYYERYANIWHYGNPPYTHWVFEYGPLAALVIYLPLLADLMGAGAYYVNYKLLSFLFELGMFMGLTWYNDKRKNAETWPLLLYLMLTTCAKNWLYEGIDMIFCSLAVGGILVLASTHKWKKIFSWILLWASTAVKFLTLPLIAPFYLITRGKWRESLLTFTLTFLLIWGGPLAYYRSSLSVPFIYNSGRTIKYNTITHLILRTLNNITHTEVQSQEAPDYSFQGPASSMAAKVLTLLYPISLLVILLAQLLIIYHSETGKWLDKPGKMWSWLWRASHLSDADKVQLAAWCYFSYFMVSFFTAKIFSNPFCLWMLPLIVILDWREEKCRRQFVFWLSMWAILELTPFLTASFWRLQSFAWFRFELFEVSYGWVKWLCVAATAWCGMREMISCTNIVTKVE